MAETSSKFNNLKKKTKKNNDLDKNSSLKACFHCWFLFLRIYWIYASVTSQRKKARDTTNTRVNKLRFMRAWQDHVCVCAPGSPPHHVSSLSAAALSTSIKTEGTACRGQGGAGQRLVSTETAERTSPTWVIGHTVSSRPTSHTDSVDGRTETTTAAMIKSSGGTASLRDRHRGRSQQLGRWHKNTHRHWHYSSNIQPIWWRVTGHMDSVHLYDVKKNVFFLYWFNLSNYKYIYIYLYICIHTYINIQIYILVYVYICFLLYFCQPQQPIGEH